MKAKDGRINVKFIIISLATVVLAVGILFASRLTHMRKRVGGETTREIVFPMEMGSLPAEGEMMDERKRPPVPSVKIGDRAWWRNPFIPLSKPLSAKGSGKNKAVTAQTMTLELQGIVKSNRKYRAIINGKSVGVGEYIGSWKVVKIDGYHVWLGGGTRTVKLDLVEKPGRMEER